MHFLDKANRDLFIYAKDLFVEAKAPQAPQVRERSETPSVSLVAPSPIDGGETFQRYCCPVRASFSASLVRTMSACIAGSD
jgi:hypothetical protein